MLLCEEMCWVMTYFEWWAGWWEDRQGLQHVNPILNKGLTAYALEHAILFWRMGDNCDQYWASLIACSQEILAETVPKNRSVESDGIISSISSDMSLASDTINQDELPVLDDHGLQTVEEEASLILELPDLDCSEDGTWEEESVGDIDFIDNQK
ncbi:hypothetical protein M422DRAFT_247261 [Sphaerobolus stellatus SS14]|nr:hypothetical protein M422DRAFT_247261 [Sphaerobolus stellatus SS14]